MSPQATFRVWGWIQLGAFALLGPAPRLAAQVGEDFMTGLEFDALTYHSGALYWKADCLPGELSRIQRSASGAPEIHTYFQPSTCGPTRVRSRNLAVDANRRVYWVTGGGEVVTLAGDAVAGTAPTVLSSLENNAAAHVHIAVSGQFVYWAESFGELSESGRIFRAPLGGGARSLILELPPAGGGGATFIAAATVPGGLAVPPTETVYFRRSFGPLLKTYLRIVLPWTTDTIAPNVQGVAVADGRLWFAEADGSGAFAISSVAMNNTLAKTFHASVPQNGVPTVASLTADAAAVYWQEVRGSGGPVMRCLRGGNLAEPITAGMNPLPHHAGIVSDGRHLFWGAGGGVRQTVIKRLPVNAAAVHWNLAATGMELIQAVQNPANSVPLVAGKPAWLRVSGRIASTSSGADSVLVGMSVRGFAGGAALPGSPLFPTRGAQTAYTRMQDRGTEDEGWWFRIPAGWMQDNLRLEAEINPDGSIIEGTRGDNTISRTFDVHPRGRVRVRVHPLRTHQGVISGYMPAYQALEDLAEHLLPTHELKLDYVGGPVIEEWQGTPFPWSFGPYELSASDDDSFWVLLKLGYRRIVFEAAAPFGPDVVFDAGLFHSFPTRAFNGLALPSAGLLICDFEPGGAQDLNRPRSGVTLAHEVAHNFDRQHVNCGGPADPDPAFPHPPCQLDAILDPATGHQGYNPFAPGIVRASAAADLMSYASLRWTSDYSWQAVFDAIGGPAAGMQHRINPRAPTGRKLLLAAAIGETGSSPLQPALLLPDASAVARAVALVSEADDDATFVVRVLGAGGAVLQSVPAGLFEPSDAGMRPVFAIIDEDPAAERVELAPAANPAVSLSHITGGGAAPEVGISAPVVGSVAGEVLQIRWEASDPEGQEVRSAVRYSHDGGASWRLLAEDLRRGELDVPTADLPGSAPFAALVEVLATDGLRTTSSLSGAFTVPRKGPRPFIVLETRTERECLVPDPLLRPGEPVVLHGVAHDAEDGPADAASLGWTLAGPTAATASGAEFVPPTLRPGSYLATLRTLDSHGTPGEATLPFRVDRIRVRDLPAAPDLDGFYASPAAGDDPQLRHPIPIPYPNGTFGIANLARHQSFLYVTVSGLPLEAAVRDRVAVSVDPSDGAETVPQATSRRFTAYVDGGLFAERGDGAGWTLDAAPGTFTARAAADGGRWSAEFRIPLSAMGGWNGQDLRIEIAANGRHWFGSGAALADDPSRWARVSMSGDADPAHDADGDGLPDLWEIAAFGDTSRDGSGDFDGDLQSDGREYAAGTDPASALSRFQLGPSGREGSVFVLRWSSVEGRLYDVEVSADLEAFTAVASNLPGTGGEMAHPIVIPSGLQPHESFFARLKVRPGRP